MALKVNRGDGTTARPIGRIKLAQFSWASGASAASTVTMPLNGIMRVMIVVVSSSTNSVTATVAITDEDSYTLYSLGTIGAGATTVTTLTADTEIWVPSGSSVTVTPSGDPGTTGVTVDVTFIARSPK